MLVLVGLTVHALFKIHDHLRSSVVRLPQGVVFPSITQANLDSSFMKFIGYLINYAFIKFGLEVHYISNYMLL